MHKEHMWNAWMTNPRGNQLSGYKTYAEQQVLTDTKWAYHTCDVIADDDDITSFRELWCA